MNVLSSDPLRPSGSAHLSPFELEELRLGEVAAARGAEAEAHLRGCRRCRDSEAALQDSRQRFDSDVLPRTLPVLKKRWEARAGQGTTPATQTTRPAMPAGEAPVPAPVMALGWMRWMRRLSPRVSAGRAAGLLVPAMAGVVVIVAVAAGRLAGGPARDPMVRDGTGAISEAAVDPDLAVGIKGGARPTFAAMAEQGGRVFALAAGRALRPGDRVRFVLNPGPHRFALVASVDGAGRASIYHPFKGPASAPAAPYRRFEVPGSIVLDEAPGPERLFALYSDQPLTSAKVQQALAAIGAAGAAAVREQAAVDLPGTAAQLSILLEKDTP